jgi:hypothetical protein
MIEFIIYVLILFSIVYLMAKNITLKAKNMSLTYDTLQAYVDRNIVAEKLNIALLQRDSAELEKTDDFLVFISQSRDWAFAYIETTQEQINNFINDVGPIIEYLDQYSPPILLEEQRLRLIEGYRTIQNILPEDYGKQDN